MAKKNYENFPLSLAFFDALPVLFFGIAVLLIAIRFENILFITGAFLCTLAGLGKVIWKIIIAGTRKDIVWMNRQLRVLMPVGFLLIFSRPLARQRHHSSGGTVAEDMHFSHGSVFQYHRDQHDLYECVCRKTGWHKTPLQLDRADHQRHCTGMLPAGGAQSPLDCPHHMPIRSSCCICSFVS